MRRSYNADSSYKEMLDVEFKSDVKCYSDHDLIEEIVGMANTVGGILYLGVEDDGTITGVHKSTRMQLELPL